MILNFVILKKKIRPHSRKVLKYSFGKAALPKISKTQNWVIVKSPKFRAENTILWKKLWRDGGLRFQNISKPG